VLQRSAPAAGAWRIERLRSTGCAWPCARQVSAGAQARSPPPAPSHQPGHLVTRSVSRSARSTSPAGSARPLGRSPSRSGRPARSPSPAGRESLSPRQTPGPHAPTPPGPQPPSALKGPPPRAERSWENLHRAVLAPGRKAGRKAKAAQQNNGRCGEAVRATPW